MLRRPLSKEEIKLLGELQKLIVFSHYKRNSAARLFLENQKVLEGLLSHDKNLMHDLYSVVTKVEEVVKEGRRLASVIGCAKNIKIRKSKEKRSGNIRNKKIKRNRKSVGNGHPVNSPR